MNKTCLESDNFYFAFSMHSFRYSNFFIPPKLLCQKLLYPTCNFLKSCKEYQSWFFIFYFWGIWREYFLYTLLWNYLSSTLTTKKFFLINLFGLSFNFLFFKLLLLRELFAYYCTQIFVRFFHLDGSVCFN